MTDRPKVVGVKLTDGEMDVMLAEQAIADEEIDRLYEQAEGALQTSWFCLDWAKAQGRWKKWS